MPQLPDTIRFNRHTAGVVLAVQHHQAEGGAYTTSDCPVCLASGELLPDCDVCLGTGQAMTRTSLRRAGDRIRSRRNRKQAAVAEAHRQIRGLRMGELGVVMYNDDTAPLVGDDSNPADQVRYLVVYRLQRQAAKWEGQVRNLDTDLRYLAWCEGAINDARKYLKRKARWLMAQQADVEEAARPVAPAGALPPTRRGCASLGCTRVPYVEDDESTWWCKHCGHELGLLAEHVAPDEPDAVEHPGTHQGPVAIVWDEEEEG